MIQIDFKTVSINTWGNTHQAIDYRKTAVDSEASI